jgi:hypothetical protein
MRALRFLSLAILLTLVATTVSMFAQDEQQEVKPPRQEEPRPEAKQGEMKPPAQDEAKPPKEEKKEEKQNQDKEIKKDQKQEEKQSPDQMKDNHPMAQQETHARPAGKSARIPDDKFHSNFGRGHKFAVQRTTISGGQSGFVYGGYSFVFVDAWPADWAYSDDCYVDYIDGEYFLFDLLHPGVRIALFVVM